MPLCVLAESGRVGFPAVHSSAVAVVHRQVHLRKISYAGEIFCSYKFNFNTRLSWLVQVPNLRSHICSSKGNQVMSTWTRSIFQKTKDIFFQPCKWIERFREEFVQQFHHCKLSKSWKVKVIPSFEKRVKPLVGAVKVCAGAVVQKDVWLPKAIRGDSDVLRFW